MCEPSATLVFRFQGKIGQQSRQGIHPFEAGIKLRINWYLANYRLPSRGLGHMFHFEESPGEHTLALAVF